MQLKLCDALAKLGVGIPIFQAPIGGIASAELAAEVSNAGGVGNLACTWLSPSKLEQLIEKVRAQTSKPFGANFVLDFPIEEQLNVALPLQVVRYEGERMLGRHNLSSKGWEGPRGLEIG